MKEQENKTTKMIAEQVTAWIILVPDEANPFSSMRKRVFVKRCHRELDKRE